VEQVGAMPESSLEAESLITSRLARARAAKLARGTPIFQPNRPSKSARRYLHRLSTGKRLRVAIWQAEDRFRAIVKGRADVFTGSTSEEAFRRLVAHHERVELADVRLEGETLRWTPANYIRR
jgi:hypothetical protein